MKQEMIFKEFNLESSSQLNELLRKGFFIVGQASWNTATSTIDYHLRRTLMSYLFRNFKR